MIYGYCRISTSQQNIERQVRNILNEFPQAIIVKEVFTGTKFQGRKELDKILRVIKPGDSIVYDSVSRMSRNAEEGIELYEELFNKGVNLIFLNEPHVNTDVYRKTLSSLIQMTGTNVDFILEGINKYLIALAKEQIRIVFQQSEKEVLDLRQRTKGGMETARLNGKQIGQLPGTKLITKKSVAAKEKIRKYNRDFNGSLSNEDTWKLIGICKTSFYKYKAELKAESEWQQN